VGQPCQGSSEKPSHPLFDWLLGTFLEPASFSLYSITVVNIDAPDVLLPVLPVIQFDLKFIVGSRRCSIELRALRIQGHPSTYTGVLRYAMQTHPMHYLGFPADLVIVTRTLYLLLAASIFLARMVPAFSRRFIDYGARGDAGSSTTAKSKNSPTAESVFAQFLDVLATLQISHSYFLIFYVLSTVLSLCWLALIATESPLLSTLAQFTSNDRLSDHVPAPPSRSTLIISMTLMLLHSARRLYENLLVAVPNPKSVMWIGHFAAGLVFYLFVHLAITVEYLPLLYRSPRVIPKDSPEDDPQPGAYSGMRMGILLILFVAASIWQNRYHTYLAGLRKYTLPTAYGARRIVAPHYTAECLLYLSLSIISAPDARLNVTMMCVLVFVVMNLGTTADSTRVWMLSKFRDQSANIESRWRLLPGVW
jgi:3-oxo-5-alpha-steroid 4-dehydrogenase 3 / polyprenol reductase